MSISCWIGSFEDRDYRTDTEVRDIYLKIAQKDWEEWFPFKPQGDKKRTQIDARLICSAIAKHDGFVYGLVDVIGHIGGVSDRAYKILRKWVKRRVGKFQTYCGKKVFEKCEYDFVQHERDYIQFERKGLSFFVDFLIWRHDSQHEDNYNPNQIGDSRNVRLGLFKDLNSAHTNIELTNDLRIFSTAKIEGLRQVLSPNRFYSLVIKKKFKWMKERIERIQSERIKLETIQDPDDLFDRHEVEVKPIRACFADKTVQNGEIEADLEVKENSLISVNLVRSPKDIIDLGERVVFKNLIEHPYDVANLEETERSFKFRLNGYVSEYHENLEIYRYSKHLCNLALLTYFQFVMNLVESKEIDQTE